MHFSSCMPFLFLLGLGVVFSSTVESRIFSSTVTSRIIASTAAPAAATQSLPSSPLPHPLQFIDPLIGTANGGHVFPGATLPFGMVKAGADVNVENQGGFSTDGVKGVYPVPGFAAEGNITGFSHMHDSGTGGSPSLGNFPIFPIALCPDDVVDNCGFPISQRATPRVNGSTIAHPGYFAVGLSTGINAEMTVTNHTALYRFTFSSVQLNSTNSTVSPLILADLTDLPVSRINASIVVDNSTGRISGSGVFQPSFGIGSYALHFCTDFSGAAVRDAGVWKNDRASTQPQTIRVLPDGVDNSPDIIPAGAWTRFHAPYANGQIMTRVGVSFISTSQACNNAEEEIPDFDFDRVHSAAMVAWQDALGTIAITPGVSVSTALQTTFWSGVYRAMLSPQDYTGENPLWSDSLEPYFDSYYCIWDSFRSIHPLLTLIAPHVQVRMVRSLLDIFRHEGWLPDCRMSLCKGFTQGGSNADVVLADLYIKMGNLAQEAGVNWTLAYEALVQDAEVEPLIWNVEGRGGLGSWKALRYIPVNDFDPYGVGTLTRSVSRTVEYAYDDFCVAQVASGLGRVADHEKYLDRAGNWINLWKADQNSSVNGTDTGFTGFLQPRHANSTWSFQDPIFCSPLLNFTSCYLNPDGHETYEGSAWLYSFYAPHAMSTLISLAAGPATFIRRLDYLHDSGLLYIGDEQAFLPVFQYHYAGAPAKSAARARTYIPAAFNTTLYGLPGNDDSGAMGSFVALSMMGFFPVAGQDVYLITPPFFQEVNITNRFTGKVATVRNVGPFAGNGSDEAVSVQSAMRDGQSWTRNWIGHDFFRDGGLLELTLGSNVTAWGTAAEDVPPSYSYDG